MVRDPRSLLSGATQLAGRANDEAHFALTLLRAGLLGPVAPHKAVGALRALERWGMLGAAIRVAAARHGDRVGVIDDRGSVTYAELDRRSNALANAWLAHGLLPGDGVAILCRNHRWFLLATFACAKAGARAIFLNTDFAGPQIREVSEREGTRMLVHDDEYGEFLAGVEPPLGRWRAWAEGGDAAAPDPDTLDHLIETGSDREPPRPERKSSFVILTSGTTGTPKGAPRDQPNSLAPIGGVLSKVPLRSGEVTAVCAPLFHALGFLHGMIGVGLGSTLILRRRFDPDQVLADVARHHTTAMIVVPIMLARILDERAKHPDRDDLSSLRIVFVSGSALGAELAKRTLKDLGPVVYNLYGSTEVAYATIATPEDLVCDPATVGRVPRGAVVKVIDDAGDEVPTGTVGRVFVGNSIAFEGYTGGGHKEVVAGLMSSGDVGHFDERGLLFIDGRDDDMIVSGGENVFPAEVEDLISGLDGVKEAAVVGVEDAKFGQRLRAFVVPHEPGGISEDEVKQHVRDNLARYKSPRDVIFVDALPRNPTGKVLKRKLAEHDGQQQDV
ncbi:Long-chain-fatty-acid--CoA ligase [Patulibacter medicamentivorans]|uniref:Long-chain-fatty-acid--CoA ligase n=1 Tax=Patulibacter medicamentivorans TaxID=1097667 RepID=H0E831_9ACTN|nr:acyl-CoA synthetase [Patulibacter medicamentivorans]EHN10154.1 Long-chain-fatty-acid--CoA ligase [Patulibacter medicamentivorans]